MKHNKTKQKKQYTCVVVQNKIIHVQTDRQAVGRCQAPAKSHHLTAEREVVLTNQKPEENDDVWLKRFSLVVQHFYVISIVTPLYWCIILFTYICFFLTEPHCYLYLVSVEFINLIYQDNSFFKYNFLAPVIKHVTSLTCWFVILNLIIRRDITHAVKHEKTRGS